jgi:cellulose synthase/poly-beta-1,6-N-acetylglucosamine synthase-like glycosyltransferase
MYWLAVILILPYIFILIRIYKSLLKIKPFNCAAEPETFVSVVVACRNEEQNLPFLLSDLASQNYPSDMLEVIIINDNSTDKTADIVEGFKGSGNIHLIENSGQGKKQALRTGIIAAKGTLIITTDSDCSAGRNWIRTIGAFYEMNNPDLIICPVQIKSSPGLFGKFIELEFLSLQGITAGTALSDKGTMCNGANLAFAREAYLNHSDNLHDEINSGDDIFLLHSLKKMPDSKILWLESPDAMVTTESPSTLRSFLKQRNRWISKGKAYKDLYTILLAITTFLTISLQISFFIAWIICPVLIWVLLSIFVLKSIPDFLILLNTTGRYNKSKLMRWFLPAQLIYPFYVLSVVFYALIFRNK